MSNSIDFSMAMAAQSQSKPKGKTQPKAAPKAKANNVVNVNLRFKNDVARMLANGHFFKGGVMKVCEQAMADENHPLLDAIQLTLPNKAGNGYAVLDGISPYSYIVVYYHQSQWYTTIEKRTELELTSEDGQRLYKLLHPEETEDEIYPAPRERWWEPEEDPDNTEPTQTASSPSTPNMPNVPNVPNVPDTPEAPETKPCTWDTGDKILFGASVAICLGVVGAIAYSIFSSDD